MARAKLAVSWYRWVILFVLWILACLAVRYVNVWYTNRPPNHIRIYDLPWVDITDANNIVYRRWRYYLKPRSYLPQKLEKYYKREPNDTYILEETLIFSYPNDEQFSPAIKYTDF